MAKICVIGDEITLTGLNLVGLKETYLANTENVSAVLDKLKDRKVIIITHTLYEVVKEKVKRIPSSTIVLELPDMNGIGEDKTAVMIKNAIGRDINVKK